MRRLKIIGNMILDIMMFIGMFTVIGLMMTVSPTPQIHMVNTDYNSSSDYIQTVSGINVYQQTIDPQL